MLVPRVVLVRRLRRNSVRLFSSNQNQTKTNTNQNQFQNLLLSNLRPTYKSHIVLLCSLPNQYLLGYNTLRDLYEGCTLLENILLKTCTSDLLLLSSKRTCTNRYPVTRGIFSLAT